MKPTAKRKTQFSIRKQSFPIENAHKIINNLNIFAQNFKLCEVVAAVRHNLIKSFQI